MCKCFRYWNSIASVEDSTLWRILKNWRQVTGQKKKSFCFVKTFFKSLPGNELKITFVVLKVFSRTYSYCVAIISFVTNPLKMDAHTCTHACARARAHSHTLIFPCALAKTEDIIIRLRRENGWDIHFQSPLSVKRAFLHFFLSSLIFYSNTLLPAAEKKKGGGGAKWA